MEIQNAGVLGYVAYPVNSAHPGFGDEANAALAKIGGFLAKYPQLQARLDAAQSRWTKALAFYMDNRSKLAATPSATVPAITSLVVDGRTYHGVALDSVRLDSVSISHSDGVAKIPLEKLSPGQITALNGTSKTVQIPADWKERLTQALEAQKKAAEVAATRLEAKPSAPVQDKSKKADSPDSQKGDPNATGDDLDPESAPSGFGESGLAEGPSYEETIKFINSGILLGQKLGFSEKAQKMVLQDKISNALFDPTDLNPDVKYGPNGPADYGLGYYVLAQCTNRVPKVISRKRQKNVGERDGVNEAVVSKPRHAYQIYFRCRDSVDAEKLARAISHLINMFGGKPDPF